jgi:hypothetical protein
MISKFPKNGMAFALKLAEPYWEEDGTPAAALIWNGQHLKLKTIEEWKKDEPEIGEYLEKEYFPEKGPRWFYPPRPVLPTSYEDVRQLHIDIQRCNEQYIEFPNDAWPSAFVTWTMGSYLTEFAPRSPLLPIFALTNSGKGQIQGQIERTAYRGKKYLQPTPATLFRQADRFRMTFALDEIQDLDQESLRRVLNLAKGSFDGTSVPRYNPDTQEVDEFTTRSFFAVSFKTHRPKEDVTNRGILLTMRMNSTPKRLVEGDTDEDKELRGRLMGLRLKALSDSQFLEEARKEAIQLGAPEVLGFDRRPKDIATSLLLPAIMSKQVDELIEVIRDSNAEAREAVNSTFHAKVQFIIEELYEELGASTMGKPKIYVSPNIRDRVEEKLREEGEQKVLANLTTQQITGAVKSLGYTTETGTGRNKYIDLGSKMNRAAFESNRLKFGFHPAMKEGC